MTTVGNAIKLLSITTRTFLPRKQRSPRNIPKGRLSTEDIKVDKNANRIEHQAMLQTSDPGDINSSNALAIVGNLYSLIIQW